MEKVSINLVAASDFKKINGNSLKISKSQQCIKIIDYISKKLGMNASDIFLYQREYAIYPDTYIGELCDHISGFSEDTAIDIFYGSRSSYG